jgi:hypothetical protein
MPDALNAWDALGCKHHEIGSFSLVTTGLEGNCGKMTMACIT